MFVSSSLARPHVTCTYTQFPCCKLAHVWAASDKNSLVVTLGSQTSVCARAELPACTHAGQRGDRFAINMTDFVLGGVILGFVTGDFSRGGSECRVGMSELTAFIHKHRGTRERAEGLYTPRWFALQPRVPEQGFKNEIIH